MFYSYVSITFQDQLPILDGFQTGTANITNVLTQGRRHERLGVVGGIWLYKIMLEL